MPAQELREAVPGLAGIAGALLFPALGAWFRVLLEYIEWNRPGIARPKRMSGLSLLRAVVLSMSLAFFVFALFRAASELRDLHAEAQVVGPSLQGALVGIGLWAVYAVAFGALLRDFKKRRSEHRFGSGLLR